MLDEKITCGFAICASFCTFKKTLAALSELAKTGMNIIPIMSFNTFETDTRFGKAEDFNHRVEEICSNPIIHTLTDAEPIGPKALLDILIICPCTGNTLAKLAAGIADTPVTLAAKSHLRNQRPVLIAISTNDALSAAAKNIGELHNRKNIFFVPYSQDDSEKKPNSVVADYSKILTATESALEYRQLQPVLTD